MHIARSLQTLLTGLVDYAGLFPPAQLDMHTVVHNYAAYRQTPEAWALGRLIVPASRLAEFGVAWMQLEQPPTAPPWLISVLINDPAADFAHLSDQLAPLNGQVRIDTAEFKASTPAAIQAAACHIPRGITAYVELPLSADLPDLIATLVEVGARAKVRSGGITSAMFPQPAELLHFIAACVRANVPFKATAGLHHPLRAEYRLTYAPDSATGTMYGFLNVFLTAAALYAGAREDQAAALLIESDPASLRWADDGVIWRDLHLDTTTLGQSRERSAIAFGSCSFVEPIEDLQRLNFM